MIDRTRQTLLIENLLYEDVAICARLWSSGRTVLLCPQATVVHAAQRASRRSLRHSRWHLASMLRYFAKHWGRLPGVAGGPAQRWCRPQR